METNHVVWCAAHHIHFLHWFVWIICFICRKKNKRNRHSKSAWCFGKEHCGKPFNRFHKAGIGRFDNRNTACILSCGQMAAKFSVSYCYKLLDVYRRRIIGCFYCIVHGEFSGDTSSNGKSGEKFEK